VTGVLCFCLSSGIFMQVLEGGRDPVNALYNRITRDKRHRDATLLSYDEIGQRSFRRLVDGPGQHGPPERGLAAALFGEGRRSTRSPSPASRRWPSSTSWSRRRR
jgi:hypothetical protein